MKNKSLPFLLHLRQSLLACSGLSTCDYLRANYFCLFILLQKRSNSVIYGIINDGTKDFPKNPTQNTNSFGGCLRDYKNSAGPVVVRISYVGSVLRVAVDTVNKSKGKRPIICFEQKDLDLPVGYHFGISVSSRNRL